jgi:hypothetical protein
MHGEVFQPAAFSLGQNLVCAFPNGPRRKEAKSQTSELIMAM